MIPILYDVDETNYTSNGIGRLADVISCAVTENIETGNYSLRIRYPRSGVFADSIKYNTTIRAIPNHNDDSQLFDVISIQDRYDGTMDIYAVHVKNRLYGIPVSPFTESSLEDVLGNLNSHAVDGPTGFRFSTLRTSPVDFVIDVPVDAGHVLRGMDGSVLDVYGGEYKYNNFEVELLESRGSDNGVSIRYAKNLKDLTVETEGMAYTGAYAYWYREELGLVTTNGCIDSDQAQFSPKPFYEVMDLSQDFKDKPTVAQLTSRVKQLIGSGSPKVSYYIEYESLYKMAEYDDLGDLEKVSNGDLVTVIDMVRGYNVKARVYEVTFDVIWERMRSISVGAYRESFTGTLANIETKADESPDRLLLGLISTKSVNVGTISSLAAQAETDVSSTTNIDNISGYYPLEVIRMRSDNKSLSFSNASLTRGASSTTVNYSCRNNSSAAVSNVTIRAIILYIKSEYAVTL